jgi:hypothetical protein
MLLLLLLLEIITIYIKFVKQHDEIFGMILYCFSILGKIFNKNNTI